MTRITYDTLQRLKREIPLRDLVEASGVELKRHGSKDLVGRCPFHADDTPSLVVSPTKNVWNCLGACHRGGTILDWVMVRDGLTFREAALWLLKTYPHLAEPTDAPPPRAETASHSTTDEPPALSPSTPSTPSTPPSPPTAQHRDLLDLVVTHYHERLQSSPRALAYLEKRGIGSEEAIAKFRLGVADRTLTQRPELSSRTDEGQQAREALQSVGVLRERGHEHLNGSLVIPVFDESGACVGLYGRKVGDKLRMGTPRHLYLPGPHRGVWNVEGLTKTVVLCESLIDAVTFWCAGIQSVTATYGTSGFTREHLETFVRLGVEKVYLAFDADEAGDRAAEALAERLSKLGMDCLRVEFPRGTDANEYALQAQDQPTRANLAQLVAAARMLRPGLLLHSAAVAPVPTPAQIPTPTSTSTQAETAADPEQPTDAAPPADSADTDEPTDVASPPPLSSLQIQIVPESSTVHSPPEHEEPPSKLSPDPAGPDLSGDDADVLAQVSTYYHERLFASGNTHALEYLAERGVRNDEALAFFRMGFGDRTLCRFIGRRRDAAGATLRARLQKMGLLWPTGHERLRGAIVFPVLDEAGRVVELYGRRGRDRCIVASKPKHFRLTGTPFLYNVAGLKGQREIIACESPMDVLSFWCAGLRNVVGFLGTGPRPTDAFTDEHLHAFVDHGIRRVYIAFDRDAAGEQGAEALAAALVSRDIECLRVLFPLGRDANDCHRAGESLADYVRSAHWLGGGSSSLPQITLAPPSASPSQIATASPRSPQSPSESPEDTHTSSEPLSDGSQPMLFEAPATPPPGPPAAAPVEPAAPPTAALPAATVEASLPSPAPHPQPRPASPAPPTRPAIPRPTPPVAGPASPPSPIPTDVRPHEVVIDLGDRRYRVRGLEKNKTYDQLRVNLLVARGATVHVDTLELYSARHRLAFIKQAAEELAVDEGVVKGDVAKVLRKLEELQAEQIRAAEAPAAQPVVLSPEERHEALELLRDPHLLQRLLDDFQDIGIVGEETNKLLGYVAATSRKLESPLAVIIQSSSAAGKSSLMEGIISFIPEEDRVKYSAMTGQSLYYMGQRDLRHKLLAIVEEEGAERASYALKLLQSEGELTIASTGKDGVTGRLTTHEYHVEGPVGILLTTTAVEVDEELQNRCVVLTVDEARGQTRAIQELQRSAETLEGQVQRARRLRVLKLHRNAQRLLRPLMVVNPWALELTFLDDKTRTRRDHKKYLTLIRAVALLHQYQRPIRTVEVDGVQMEYVEASLEDIETANRLAHEVLGRTLDELAPQTRNLLLQLDAMVAEGCRRMAVERCEFHFTRRQIRDFTGWGDSTLKKHLYRLLDLEYLVAHRMGRGQGLLYELLYDGKGKDGRPFLMGLLDVASLQKRGSSPLNGVSSPPGHPGSSRSSPPGSGGPAGQDGSDDGASGQGGVGTGENAYRGAALEGKDADTDTDSAAGVN